MVDYSSKHFTSNLDNIWLGIGNVLMIPIFKNTMEQFRITFVLVLEFLFFKNIIVCVMKNLGHKYTFAFSNFLK
jgi:hypothetical protein